MTQAKKQNGVIERGNIYFLYRPKIGETQLSGEKDVERFYMVMSPEGKKIFREIIIGQKELPQVTNGGQKNWGFVNLIAHSPDELQQDLGTQKYATKTRGEREVQPARPAGEGVYAIVRHDNHTHLAYSLELPDKPDEVQQELQIEEEASYIISVKNPLKPSPRKVGLRGRQKAGYPKNLLNAFGDKRFADADPPELLDYEGAEIMLMGASEDPEQELNIKLEASKESTSSADVFKELHLNKKEHPVRPLFQGKWE